MNIISLHTPDLHNTGKNRSAHLQCDLEEKQKLKKLIQQNGFDVHFQPIVSLSSKEIFGYEGLCRVATENPFGDIETLFSKARMYDEICGLDMLCRKNSIRLAASQKIKISGKYLFLNICPTSLQQSGHTPGETEKMIKRCGLKKENVILELTEQEAISNYPLFLEAIKHYRKSGFKIAIDDFGAGYGGLKMLSLVAPDFIKIDRHFIRNIDNAHLNSHINYSLIDSIATICHRLGIQVIAEGVETINDVKICDNFGIDLFQGYCFARPTPQLVPDSHIRYPQIREERVCSNINFGEAICIGDIMTYANPVYIGDRVLAVLERFKEDPQLYCLPVLSAGDMVCGVINRHRFMEKHMVGRHGYGMNLNYYKKVKDILEPQYLQVPHYTAIEEVAQKINGRENISMYDDICVTRSGKYMGTVAVGSILNAVTKKSISYAKGANPLTGLPGNEFIQREIAKMLSQSVHFDVCYLDIDSFKPYNDKHGYSLGDEVIKEVGRIVNSAAKRYASNGVGFAGHIGGDDFIVITRPKDSIAASEFIINNFNEKLSHFHTEASMEEGHYAGFDRAGKKNYFSLLSLSIGIVSTEVHHITSPAEVSSIATDLKKRAKMIKGSSIVRDRRVQSWLEVPESCKTAI